MSPPATHETAEERIKTLTATVNVDFSVDARYPAIFLLARVD